MGVILKKVVVDTGFYEMAQCGIQDKEKQVQDRGCGTPQEIQERLRAIAGGFDTEGGGIQVGLEQEYSSARKAKPRRKSMKKEAHFFTSCFEGQCILCTEMEMRKG